MKSRIREPRLDPPYDSFFSGLLSFATLAETEKTITRLENLRQRFLAASDKKGVAYCHQLALAGRQRAEMIARNRRVGAGKRLQKREAALWFQIWLETPELFSDWLALRKASEDYRKI
jgi:hypothetical protein